VPVNSMNAHSPDHFDELDVLVRNSAFKMKINELGLAERYDGRNQDIKVSIIMPTWNRVSVIRRAID